MCNCINPLLVIYQSIDSMNPFAKEIYSSYPDIKKKNKGNLMKKQFLATLSIALLVLCNPITAVNEDNQKQTIIEKWLPTVYTAAWIGTIATEALALAFAPIHHILYGNNAASESSAKIIHNVIESVKLQQPLDIKNSRSLWTSLGENVFSHQSTLFVNPNAFSQPNLIISDSLKTEIVSATVAMNNNYDTKILTASIAIPLAVWAAVHYANKLLQKLNSSEDQSDWIKKAITIAEQCKKSFYIKTGVSLSILAGYMLYQKHLIANITHALLTGK